MTDTPSSRIITRSHRVIPRRGRRLGGPERYTGVAPRTSMLSARLPLMRATQSNASHESRIEPLSLGAHCGVLCAGEEFNVCALLMGFSDVFMTRQLSPLHRLPAHKPTRRRFVVVDYVTSKQMEIMLVSDKTNHTTRTFRDSS